MAEQQVATGTVARRVWWSLTALFAVAIVIDLIDVDPLRLAMSCLLFVATLTLATSPEPRTASARARTTASVVAALGILVYRLLGPGL
jgi:hypothetical protein